MTVLKQLYYCPICGNVTEVVFTGAEALVCCGEPMVLLQENTVDATKEKHVPELQGDEQSVTVKVGSVPHPMEEKHYIAFIELVTKDDMVLRAELKPGMEPVAVFPVPMSNVLYAREYCNLHKLWKSS
ncbi:MAG: desulfoferrodoxin [Candidatus Cloacimonadaceae bacterium]